MRESATPCESCASRNPREILAFSAIPGRFYKSSLRRSEGGGGQFRLHFSYVWVRGCESDWTSCGSVDE